MRPKQDSDRRWLARFMLGEFIPSIVLEQRPALRKRMMREETIYSVRLDGICRKASRPDLVHAA